jgi:hypothetical protein
MWELCRRGILRPGIKAYRRQSTEEGNAGNGYSLTLRGKDWIQESGQYDYVPIEPGRLARMLDDYAAVFGEGFSERSQEAVRCYSALAYLACCVMCGAAAESIILALAIEKTGDEASVLKEYSSSGGRGRLEKYILDDTPKPIQNEFRGYTNLLKYWRDTASHGKRASIADNEAFTSLALLLRFAAFARDNWERLTT